MNRQGLEEAIYEINRGAESRNDMNRGGGEQKGVESRDEMSREGRSREMK